MSVGKRIYLKRNLPDLNLVRDLEQYPTANLADVMNRNVAMHPRIKLISKPNKKVISGIALTVKTRAGDNLALHAALNIAKENDILIVSNESDDSRAVMGEIMINYLKYVKKATAVVIDGPIRDIDVLKNIDFPIYATGSCPGGPYKDGPGEVNTPISAGNIIINPGDAIVLDSDGVIVVPKEDIRNVLISVKTYAENDSLKTKLAKEGKQDRTWVDNLLKNKEFEIIDDIYKY